MNKWTDGRKECFIYIDRKWLKILKLDFMMLCGWECGHHNSTVAPRPLEHVSPVFPLITVVSRDCSLKAETDQITLSNCKIQIFSHQFSQLPLCHHHPADCGGCSEPSKSDDIRDQTSFSFVKWKLLVTIQVQVQSPIPKFKSKVQVKSPSQESKVC